MPKKDIFRLDDKVALIAGGGGAIGSAIGQAFANSGAKVVLLGHSKGNTEAAAQQVGSDALAVVADATSEAECEAAVEQAVGHFGRVDICVNAVGGGAGTVLHNAEDYPRDDWDWIFELNLRSIVVTTQAAVKQMIAAGEGGKVLNLISVRAFPAKLLCELHVGCSGTITPCKSRALDHSGKAPADVIGRRRLSGPTRKEWWTHA